MIPNEYGEGKRIMKKGIISSVIISIISVINLFVFLFLLLPFDAQAFIESNQMEEEADIAVLAITGIIAGYVIVIMYAWMLLIAVIHGICLIFTVKNRKAVNKWIRIYNYVLNVVNVFLVEGPLVKILVNLNWEILL